MTGRVQARCAGRGLVALIAVGLLGSAAGCGGGDVYYAIPPFGTDNLTMVLDSTIPLNVALNRPAKKELQVTASVEAPFTGALQLSPSTLVYAVGQQSLTMQVKALARTNDVFATVNFAIVGEPDATQIWRVRVE